MTDTEDLSFVADALLEMCAKERTAPFLTEEGFERRLQRFQSRERRPAEELISGRGDAMLSVECRDVMQGAGLTERQREVLEMRLDGFTFDEIGQFRRITKQGAKSVFIQALKKIARTFRDYRYAGLSEVYRSEVKRRTRGGSFGTMGR